MSKDVSAVEEQSDVKRLHEMGYAQELLRRMGAFSNFAVSFTIISILSGCLTAYGIAMNAGGPIAITLGWPLVGILVTFVGLSMAEVCSSYPTAGGLYYWSAKLAKKNGAAWSWFTGWFNLLGQVAVTAGIDFGLATFVGAFLSLTVPSLAAPTRPEIIIIYGIILLIHGLLNTFGISLVALLNDVSVWWHLLGVAIIVGAVLIGAHARLQSPTFVFTTFVNNTGFTFFGVPVYVFFLGLLLAQYTFTGYDASAHMTEETHNAAIAGPRGIVNSILISLVAGWVLLLGLTFAIGNYNAVLGSATGAPPVQIFIDAIGQNGALVLLLIVMGAQFFCGMSSVTANSRMLYAFSRDGAVPGASFWHQVNKRTHTPTNSIWFAAVFAFALGIPYLWNTAAYGAVVSIAVIGLYIAYIIPIFLRLRAGKSFQVGPWNLGRWSYVVGWIAVIWVVFICILFVLPTVAPITRDNFNYASVAVGAVLLGSGAGWLLSARKWFKGPKVQGTPAELAAIEHELETVGVAGSLAEE